MQSEDLLVHRPQPEIVLIQINRPERRNALGTGTLRALVEAIEAGDADLAERMSIAHIRQVGEDLVLYLGVPQEALESKARSLSASFSPEE